MRSKVIRVLHLLYHVPQHDERVLRTGVADVVAPPRAFVEREAAEKEAPSLRQGFVDSHADGLKALAGVRVARTLGRLVGDGFHD